MATPSIARESCPWDYDVFLSFRGEDTRKTFTDHLYFALHQAGIRTFRDEEELRKGEYLAPELMRAIQSSRIAVIVFSKDYASSRWCLDELVEIVELKEKGKLIVFPIFYNVNPSDVCKQSESYGMVMSKHKERFHRSDKVRKWRDALTKVADMSGWDLQGVANGYESKFIDEIVQDILRAVSRRLMYVAKHVVGLESRVDDVLQFNYGTHDNDVRMIGIYGMGGIGKSTLAKALYNKLFGYFERSYFLEITSVILETKKLQEELLSKLLKRKIEIGSEGEGKMLIEHLLQAKKCLIVLDNLEHKNQFEALCGERDWFGKGSILILTTRDAHLLKELKEDELYKAEALVHEESLQLFSLHAFREPTLPKEDYAEVLDGIVTYCDGLPLALEVIGSFLSDKSKEEWISAFEKLRKILHNDVLAKLKISYEGLPDDQTKSLFLDLVCFSHKISKETINARGYFSTIEIRNLVDKCLINYSWYCSMHSLIREMGREIIRSESPNKPGERSRLWCPNDIHDVLIEQKGTEKIEMIVLNSPMKNREYKYNTKAFKDMKNLRFLQIDGIHLEGNFKHLPCKALRCLQWNQCPLKYIPSDYFFGKLVKLEMSESNMKEFGAPLKYFQCLESLDLRGCKYLTRTPNFSGAKNLRTLSFLGCLSLEKVHSSIGDLSMLIELNFWGCKRLKKLPKKFWHWHLKSVEDPSSVENSRKLTSLRILSLDERNIHSLLPSNTTSHLLKPRKSIPNLRRSFFQNDHLKLIPQFPPNLEKIYLWGSKNLGVVLPALPTYLRCILLNDCTNLKMLSKLPQNLQSLSAINCESLETVHLPKMLKDVNLIHCKKLKEIQGWENAQLLTAIRLPGVPNIKLSEIINKLDSNIQFEGYLSNNETLSWIKFEENGSSSSSISFQLPPSISNLEFLGICIWVLLRQFSDSERPYKYYLTIEKDVFRVEYWNFIHVEAFVNFIPRDFFKVIKAGEIFKVILKVMISKEDGERYKDVSKGMLNKIRVEALYRDKEDGFLQFLPLTKLDSSIQEEEEEGGGEDF